MTKQEFKQYYLSQVKDCPKSWRKGQAIFNLADEDGWARTVQFKYKIDCFYVDDQIDAFLNKGYELVAKQNNWI